mmetsp:Transcript_22539/g.36178  ORF Transcript_22539/g.36178 Transcript_22539/m.36178 type:complete len:243 (+) Transcript_22539:813-1541(+)
MSRNNSSPHMSTCSTNRRKYSKTPGTLVGNDNTQLNRDTVVCFAAAQLQGFATSKHLSALSTFNNQITLKTGRAADALFVHVVVSVHLPTVESKKSFIKNDLPAVMVQALCYFFRLRGYICKVTHPLLLPRVGLLITVLFANSPVLNITKHSGKQTSRSVRSFTNRLKPSNALSLQNRSNSRQTELLSNPVIGMCNRMRVLSLTRRASKETTGMLILKSFKSLQISNSRNKSKKTRKQHGTN